MKIEGNQKKINTISKNICICKVDHINSELHFLTQQEKQKNHWEAVSWKVSYAKLNIYSQHRYNITSEVMEMNWQNFLKIS